MSLVLTYGKLLNSPNTSKTDEVWGEELLAQMPEYRGKTLYEVLYENGEVNKFKVPTDVPGYINDEADYFGYYLQKGLFEEYATSVVVMVMT